MVGRFDSMLDSGGGVDDLQTFQEVKAAHGIG